MCGSGGATKNVTVAPVPQISINAPSSMTANTSGTATVTSNLTSTYNWSITNGSITGGQGTNSVAFTVDSVSPAVLSVTATAGVQMALPNAMLATAGTHTYTYSWDVSPLTAGSKIFMVECYRANIPQHYAYHQIILNTRYP